MSLVTDLCKAAAAVKYEVQKLDTQKKNEALLTAADRLVQRRADILAANKKDIEAGRAAGMSEALIDRLTLTESRIEQIAEGLRQVAQLPDPVGEVMEEFVRPNGMKIRKIRVPMGVIGVIYESRPNVTADAFALCFKAGSAVILKGGSDAINSNIAITQVLRDSLEACGITPDAVQLVATTDRAATRELMTMRQYIDVLIPRGGAGLIRAVVEGSKIPVIETGTGNCHIYVDKDADLEMAMKILVNAKTQRIGVCNAAESLVVHRAVLDEFLPMLAKTMEEYGVTLRADEDSRSMLPLAEAATEEDFGKEYLALMLSVKTVDSVEEAIEHINRYHTGHSDCIVTKNREAAEKFLREIDSACVYVNVSTRFTDGFEFGFGAEIGISTQKLQARGPMGLREITSYKYQITGDGQIRG
ncbi:MAG: glutamate-5-semialdehyde dehydrogenase [Lachnospiraceae bacterium]|nr:glutamate-5-semialdehyde dehydrogenase [Lachnospiraceae bacterium]